MDKIVNIWDFVSIGNSHKNFNLEIVKQLTSRGVRCEVLPEEFEIDLQGKSAANSAHVFPYVVTLLRSSKFLFHFVFGSKKTHIILAVDNSFGLVAILVASLLRPDKKINCFLHNNFRTLSRSFYRLRMVRYFSKKRISFLTLAKPPQEDFCALGIKTALILHPLPSGAVPRSTGCGGIAIVGRGNNQALVDFPELQHLLSSSLCNEEIYVQRGSKLYRDLISSCALDKRLRFYDAPQCSSDYFEFIAKRSAVLLPAVYDSRGSVSGIFLDALASSVPIFSYPQKIVTDLLGSEFRGYIPRGRGGNQAIDFDKLCEELEGDMTLAKNSYLSRQILSFDLFVKSIE